MAMKRIFLVLALLSGLCVRAAAPLDTEKIWNDANTAYVNADYPAATEGYERLLGEGYESAQLYLNLGNAYFKRGMNGRAILNYRKALRLAPGDEDIRYNLSIAEARTQDRIESVPVFFVKRWIVSLGRSVGSNTWAVLSLVFFALMLFCTGVYLLLRRVSFQKAGFCGALVSLLLFVVSVAYASAGRKARLHLDEAVVMSSAAPVKSSPDASSTDIFVLHEGTKVGVRNSLGDWREIVIADGNKGWIQASAIEMID